MSFLGRMSRCLSRLCGLAFGVFIAMFLEAVGDVFEEDDAVDDVLVFSCVQVAAKLVRRKPKFGFNADVGGGIFAFGSGTGFRAGHGRIQQSPMQFLRGPIGVELARDGIREPASTLRRK